MTSSAPPHRPRARAEVGRWIDEIAEHRQTLGITCEQIAAAVGVDTATVASWELHRRVPGLSNLVTLGREVGVHMEIFKDGSLLRIESPTPAAATWEQREIHRLLRTLRSARTVMQRELALKIGVSRRALSTFEAGLMTPRAPTFAAWASELRCTVRWKHL